MFIIYLLTIVSAIIGLSITLNIYKQKHEKKPLVCPFGADCHSVIESNFSSFLGVGLEIYGAAYYSFIATVYLLFMIFPESATALTVFILTGVTVGGFLFSLYLTFVQAFLIKSWCSWCLMSAGVSTAIFIFTIIGVSISDVTFIPLLAEYKPLILIAHLLGFAFGLGGATITDLLFMRFLKDFKISQAEDKILKLMSQIIWVGLFLAIISGIGLYLPNMEALNNNPKFLVKVIVVVIITINGALLNLLVSPKLTKIPFKSGGMHIKGIIRLRKLAFAFGSISFISWYTAAILGAVKTTPFAFLELLGIYVGGLLLGIVGSQVVEKTFVKVARLPSPDWR
ncbi:vitamin K epoxide reductase family protein [Candidatus Pacebacteria bacterium]|nr:vitamin K epoxide reductase family protein [Candidatus Paceibacterota bacterium]